MATNDTWRLRKMDRKIVRNTWYENVDIFRWDLIF